MFAVGDRIEWTDQFGYQQSGFVMEVGADGILWCAKARWSDQLQSPQPHGPEWPVHASDKPKMFVERKARWES